MFNSLPFTMILVTCALLMLTVQSVKVAAPPRTDLCWNYPCRRGYVCKVVRPQCIRAPCPDAMPVCVKRKRPMGACPRPKPGVVGPCVVRCWSDNDCYLNERCCGSCPRQCTKVVPVKGRCPVIPRWKMNSRRCGRPCRSNRDCSGNWVCCKAGKCGKMCMRPARRFDWLYRIFRLED